MHATSDGSTKLLDGNTEDGPPAGAEEPRERAVSSPATNPSHVVGIGASAGGLTALEELFSAMPVDSGMAFVVVQHLSPDFKSIMDDLLARQTSMPIHRVENGQVIEANAVYLIPPRQVMTTANGRLFLLKNEGPQPVLTVDVFLESLAASMGSRAVGIILSGTGCDGSRGIRAIHEAGGLILVQSSESAEFDGMPRAAASTGVCDHTVAPGEMPQLLVDYGKDPDLVRSPGSPMLSIPGEVELSGVFAHLRHRYGIDFSKYKPSTVGRRVGRRLALLRMETVAEYVPLLESDPRELELLYRDLLIGVTEFFRDAAAFSFLEAEVVPALFERVPEDGVRAWVAGCATGEEAYSLAILLLERAEAVGYGGRITVFATDAHRTSLDVAGAGVYGEEQLRSVEPHRRNRYFSPEGPNRYKVRPDLRKTVIFAAQNLLADPPLTRMDLVSCRNLLIYLLPRAQEKVLASLNFALKPNGILFLGKTEGLGRLADDFATISGTHRIHRKQRDVRLQLEPREGHPRPLGGLHVRGAPARSTVALDRQLVHDYDLLLARYMPAGALLDERHRPLHYFGDIGPFLKGPSGRTESDFARNVASELQVAVSMALMRASSSRTPFVIPNVTTGEGRDVRRVDVAVECLPDDKGGGTHYVVTFRPARRAEEPPAGRPEAPPTLAGAEASPELRTYVAELEQELRSTRETLQAAVEELQAGNEELQASNEELQASNEELQSTNEEFHSLNEELFTVNAEFERKNVELQALDREHGLLLESLATGIVYLDENLAIRRFNRASASSFKLQPQDIGRPISHIAYQLADQERMLSSVHEVLATGVPSETELKARDGAWLLQRLVPYLDQKGAVRGVLMTNTDVSGVKAQQAKVRHWEEIFRNVAWGVAVIGADATTLDLMNPAFARMHGYVGEELIGAPLSTLSSEEQRAAIEEMVRLVDQKGHHTWESTHLRKDGTTFPVLMDAVTVGGEAGRPAYRILSVKDIAERRAAEDALRESQKRLARTQKLEALGILAGGVAHDFNNILLAIRGNAALAGEEIADDHPVRPLISEIERAGKRAASLVAQILSFSSPRETRRDAADLQAVVEEAVHLLRSAIPVRIELVTSCASGLPQAVADSDQIHQAVVNLVTNAVQAIGDRAGRVSIVLDEATVSEGADADAQQVAPGRYLRIAVSDDGQGMSAETLARACDPFFTTKKQGEGTGLGLSIVHGIMKSHRGVLKLRSESGVGTVATLLFPASERSAAAAGPEASRTPGRIRRSGRVLIVDDDDAIVALTKRYLSRRGWDVAAFLDPHEALACLEREGSSIAAIVTDLSMPVMSGFDVARRARLARPEVPVVLTSGYVRAEDEAEASRLGVDRIVLKPDSVEQLAAVLDDVLSSARAGA